MLIKIFARGIGSGSGPVEYVTRLDDPITKQLRDPLPEVVRGEPEITKRLIDSLEFKHKYTSGVLSFAPEDNLTIEQQKELMDSFEKYAFAGLQTDQYNILWVRHGHNRKGRVELHFIVPRVELTTGFSLNIAPPGWRNYLDNWRDWWNYSNDWASPTDPERARIYHFGYAELINAQKERLGQTNQPDTKQLITDYLMNQMELGKITNRNQIIDSLKTLGFEIPRAGKDYITVLNPETLQRFRLKGGIYEASWGVESTTATEDTRDTRGNREDKERLIEQAISRLELGYRKRFDYNQKRYGIATTFTGVGIEQNQTNYSHSNEKILADPPSDDFRDLGKYLRWHLGDDAISLKSSNPTNSREGGIRGNHRKTTTGDMGGETDGNHLGTIHRSTGNLPRTDRLDLLRETLHQIRRLNNEQRINPDIIADIEDSLRTIHAGYEAIGRTVSLFDESTKLLAATSKQFDEATQRLNQNCRAIEALIQFQQLQLLLSQNQDKSKKESSQDDSTILAEPVEVISDDSTNDENLLELYKESFEVETPLKIEKNKGFELE